MDTTPATTQQVTWPAGGGELGDLIRAHDWAATPLGPIDAWPQSLRILVDLVLGSSVMMSLMLGPRALLIYNDAYAASIGKRHPRALGVSAFEAFADAASVFGPLFERALAGECVSLRDVHFHFSPADLPRDEAWYDLTYSPIRDERGVVAGALAMLVETTDRVLADRANAAAQQVMRANEARAQALIANLPGGVAFVVGRDLRYRLAGGEGLLAVGRRPTDFEGKTLAEALGPQAAALEPLYCRGLAGEPFEDEREEDGRVFATRGVPLRDERGAVEAVLALSFDITERKRTEAALRASEAQLAVELADAQQLQRISSSLIRDDDVAALDDQILDVARSLMRSDMASLQMLVPERQALFLLANQGFAPESARFWQWVRADDTTACGLAFARTEPILVPDVEEWEFVAGTEDLRQYRLSGIRAMLSTPLVSRDGHLVGVLSTHWRHVHQPSEREVRLLDVLARQAADLIERRTAEQALRNNQQRLGAQKEAFQAAIDGAPLEVCLAILARLVTQELAGEARTAFYLADPDGARLHPIRGAGDMPDAYLDLVDGFLIGEDSLACDLSTATGHPVLTRDVFEEPLWQPWVHIAAAYDYRGCWSFPMDTRDGRTVGTFAMYFRTAREVAPHEHALADLVTQTAAIIIARHTEAQERARAEADLRRSEQRLRTATSAARISTFEIDVATGMVEFDNNVLAVLYGVETVAPDQGPQDWAPLVEAWLRPEDAQRHTELLRATMRGEGDLHNELLVRDPATGEETWIEAQAMLVRDATGGPGRVFGIMRNIAERKQIEETLRQSEAKYRSLFESIDEAFVVVELIHDETERAVDLRYVEVNEALERQTGLAGIAGKLVSEVAPGTESSWLDTYDEVARTGQAKRFEDHHQDTGRWYDVYASRVGPAGSRQVAVVFKDVTERKEREERQAFLLKLSDAVRPLADPAEIMARVSEEVGRHFQVGRCGYAEVPPPYDHLVVARDWTSGVMQSLQGSWPLASFGDKVIAEYRSGQTVVYEDAFDDDRVRGHEAGVVAAGSVRSGIAVQLMKSDEWVATFYVQDTSARRWTQSEIALMEEIAERTWAAVERARAEAALRESERRYRLLFENMGEGFALAEMIWDEDGRPADWRYLEVNDAWAQTGVPPSQTVGRTAREVNSQLEAYWIETYGRVVQTGEPVRFEAFAQGFGKWFDTVAFPHSDNRFGLIFRDVTQRREADAALRASEARYRTLFDSMDEGFVIAEVLYDDAGRPVDALYLEGNPAASRLTGVPDYSRHRFSDVMPGAEPYWVEIYDRVARTGASERLERYLAPIERWYDFHVSRVADGASDGARDGLRRVAVVFQDVTARKRAEAALRESETRQAFLLQLSDGLRPLHDPEQIKRTAARLLGEQLAVNRVFYADAEGGHWLVARGYETGVDPLPDQPFAMSTYGDWIITGFRAGTRLVVTDMRADGRFQESERQAHLALQIGAEVAVPLVKGGELVAMLVAHDAKPREWSEREIATLEQTAERTWAAVERARAEAALRASEERLRRALSIETVGVLFFRLDGTILDANAALERLTGYTTEELRAIRHWEVLTPPEFLAATERTAAHLAERGTAAPYEKQLIRKDGTRFWGLFAPTRLAGTGRASECVEFTIDITERKQAEAAVRETEERFRALAETSPLGVGVSSTEGRIIYTNRAYEAILGYEPGGLLDQPSTIVYDEPIDRRAWLAAMDEKGSVSDYEVRFRRADGTPVLVSINVAPLEFGGKPAIIGVIRDVTDRKRAEAEREQLLVAQAVAAERQALLKRIVRAQEHERARVAREVHDSVTQLAHAAALHLDQAVELLPTSPEGARPSAERGRDLARQAANEARRLIAGLRPEMLDLAGLAGALQQEVDALRSGGWRVDFEAGGLAGVRLEPEAEITLFRVAQEALSNVRKHAGHARVRVRLQRTNGSMRLEVRDWGRGFDPTAVRPTVEGEHVGLTGMRERMDLLGGKLEVRSDPDHGTTIRATLPFEEAPPRGRARPGRGGRAR